MRCPQGEGSRPNSPGAPGSPMRRSYDRRVHCASPDSMTGTRRVSAQGQATAREALQRATILFSADLEMEVGHPARGKSASRTPSL